MSSRNAYLSAEERRAALVLSRALAEARGLFDRGERRAAAIVARMGEIIEAEPLARVDYAEVVDHADLKPLEIVEREALAALAVYIGRTRLIDNTILRTKGKRT